MSLLLSYYTIQRSEKLYFVFSFFRCPPLSLSLSHFSSVQLYFFLSIHLSTSAKIRREKNQAKWWWSRWWWWWWIRRQQWQQTVKRCKQRNHRQRWFDTIEWILHWKRSHSNNTMECKWIYNSYSINVSCFFHLCAFHRRVARKKCCWAEMRGATRGNVYYKSEHSVCERGSDSNLIHVWNGWLPICVDFPMDNDDQMRNSI